MQRGTKARVALILLVWVVLLGWVIRYYPNWVGASLPDSYGANIDWTRHAIASGHSFSTMPERPLTVLSSYAGSQSYDLGAWLMGILTLIIGQYTLDRTLSFINAFPFVALILYPAFALIFSQWDSDDSLFSAILIVALAIFPATTTVMKTASVWFPEIYATSTALLLVILIPRLRDSPRFKIIFYSLAGFSTMLYHTWVFLTLTLIGTIFLVDWSLPTNSHRERLTSPKTVLLVVTIFFLIGGYYNGRLNELTFQLYSAIAVSAGDTFHAAASSELVGSSVKDIASDLNMRRVLILTNMVASVFVVAIYGITRFARFIRRREFAFESKYDRALFASLCSFPILLIVFYAMAGPGLAIGRTRYIGVYFVVFCAAILIIKGSGWQKYASVFLSILIITSTILTFPFMPGYGPEDTSNGELEATEFSGTQIPTDSYTFSDGRLAMRLLYYNQRGILLVAANNAKWEDAMSKIYFNATCDQGLGAVRSVRNSSKEGQLSDGAVYMIFTERMESNGVHMLSHRTRPPGEFIPVYERCTRVANIYDNGNTTVFGQF